jgi:hypothetical protein
MYGSMVSRSILLGVRNASDKICRENNAFYVQHFFFENRAVYEITWKYVVELDRPQMIIQYGASALHVGQLRLQTHSMRDYLILLHLITLKYFVKDTNYGSSYNVTFPVRFVFFLISHQCTALKEFLVIFKGHKGLL